MADASREKKLKGADAADELRAGESISRPVAEYLAALYAALPPDPDEPATVNPTSISPTDPQAARMLQVYHRRLRSNLIHALRPLVAEAAAEADRLAALIDGAYLRAVLDPDMPPDRARALVMDEVRRITG